MLAEILLHIASSLDPNPRPPSVPKWSKNTRKQGVEHVTSVFQHCECSDIKKKWFWNFSSAFEADNCLPRLNPPPLMAKWGIFEVQPL